MVAQLPEEEILARFERRLLENSIQFRGIHAQTYILAFRDKVPMSVLVYGRRAEHPAHKHYEVIRSAGEARWLVSTHLLPRDAFASRLSEMCKDHFANFSSRSSNHGWQEELLQSFGDFHAPFVLLRKLASEQVRRQVSKEPLEEVASVERKTTWVEIEVVDQHGDPLPNVQLAVDVSGHANRSPRTPHSGIVRIEELPIGAALEVSLPDLPRKQKS